LLFKVIGNYILSELVVLTYFAIFPLS